MRKLLFLVVLGLLVLGLSGCTPQERSGISPLPQNRPADWENRPYGDLRI